MEEFGRDIVQSACLLQAEQHAQEPLKKNGEFDLMEKSLKIHMMFSMSTSHLPRNCSSVFMTVVSRLRATAKEDVPSFSFLRAATTIATAKEIELTVLHFLLKFETKTDDIEALNFWRSLERIALWMMLVKPKVQLRRTRCFQIINSSDNPTNLKAALDLSKEEKQEICDTLRTASFDTPSWKSIAKAILERMNEHELMIISQTRLKSELNFLQLEHVLPEKWEKEWNKDLTKIDAEKCLPMKGNFALLNQKINVKISNGSFSAKQPHLLESPYPLTRRIGNAGKWTRSTFEAHHRYLVELAIKIWDL